MYKAIDVHAHFGTPKGFPQKGLAREFLSISEEQLEKSCIEADVEAIFFSAMEGLFAANGEDIYKANTDAMSLCERYSRFYFWCIVNPFVPETFLKAEELLQHKKCVGVKIHPEAGGYQISEYGDIVFQFCKEHGSILQIHTGDPSCMPEDIVPFMDTYPEVVTILAHLGYSYEGGLDHQVNAVLATKSKNAYIDISSFRSMMCSIIEWAMERVGAEKLLYGSDVPIHHIGMMKARVEYAEISEEEKEDILYNNAFRIFGKWLKDLT